MHKLNISHRNFSQCLATPALSLSLSACSAINYANNHNNRITTKLEKQENHLVKRALDGTREAINTSRVYYILRIIYIYFILFVCCSM